MKKLNQFIATAIFTSLILSSCSSDEVLIPQEENATLLKTYSLKRDVEGNYSLNFELNDGFSLDKTFDEVTNTKNYHLFANDVNSIEKITEDLEINGEKLTVGFVDTRSNKNPKITVFDDDIKFAKTTEKKFLKEYSFAVNEEGEFLLDFTVNEGVLVDFTYNDDSETYEVHLKEGKASEQSFAKVLEKEEGKSLKLDFVNHTVTEAKADVTFSARRESSFIRKPRLIMHEAYY